MTYQDQQSSQLRSAIKGIRDRHDVRQFLIDLKEYLDERACDYKIDMETRDANQELIELLEYLKRQVGGHIEVVDLLKQENRDRWR